MLTAAEQLYQQGFAEGQLLAARKTLRRLLVLKYGPIGDLHERRIENATLAQLDPWLDRLLTAPSLAAVFAA
jgi:hypothetical protein